MKALILEDEDIEFVSRILLKLVRAVNMDLPEKESYELIKDYVYQNFLTEDTATDLGILLMTAFFETDGSALH